LRLRAVGIPDPGEEMAAPPPHLQHPVGSQTEIPVAEKPHPLGCERDAEAFSVHDDVVVSETVAFHEITREHLETPGRRLEALPTPWPLPPWERRARSIPGRARASRRRSRRRWRGSEAAAPCAWWWAWARRS